MSSSRGATLQLVAPLEIQKGSSGGYAITYGHTLLYVLAIPPFGFVHYLGVFEVILVFYVVTLVLNYRDVFILVDDIRKNCEIHFILEEKV